MKKFTIDHIREAETVWCVNWILQHFCTLSLVCEVLYCNLFYITVTMAFRFMVYISWTIRLGVICYHAPFISISFVLLCIVHWITCQLCCLFVCIFWMIACLLPIKGRVIVDLVKYKLLFFVINDIYLDVVRLSLRI